MEINLLVRVKVSQKTYAREKGIPLNEVVENLPSELTLMGDCLTWQVTSAQLLSPSMSEPSDVVKTILARPKNGSGGGIPLTRGEVAMLFLDGYAGDHPSLLDVRSQGYGEDDDWDGLTDEDVLKDENTVFVWIKWEPLELWPS